MKKSIQIAGAYIGVIVGAGFASGQEILQFFASFGWISVIGAVIAAFFFAFLGMSLTQLGSRLQTISHKQVVYHLCGPYVGVFVDLIITFFLFGVAVVMIAGTGSIFEQQFGLPSIVGNVVMAVLTIATVCLNIQKVLSLMGMITPFLLLIVVIIAIYSYLTMDLNAVEIQKIAETQNSAVSNWVLGALLYVSYNIAAGAAMLAVMGGTITDEKTAGRGGILGGIGLGLLILLIILAMLTKVNVIDGVDMPMLSLASEMSPAIGWIMSIILLGMIYNTAVGMLYAFTARLINPEQPTKFKGFAISFGIVAFIASFVGFTTLVGTLYPVMGYLGFIIMIAIIVAWFRRKREIKEVAFKQAN
ncbi:hypothetical protein [Peribacillus asahii]|uniref:YkvI family membrane protein n=1 Tax=Peribacillus asahii TaxID=228899 RepID=UPI0037F419C2